jgi:hypothetical protein
MIRLMPMAGAPAPTFVVSNLPGLTEGEIYWDIELSGGSKMSLEGATAFPNFYYGAGIKVWGMATLDIKPMFGGFLGGGLGVIENYGTVTFDSPNPFESTLSLVNYGSFVVKNSKIDFSSAGPQSGFSVVNLGMGTVDILAGYTLKARSGFNMNSGQLRQFGAGTAYLDGNLTVHGGDIWFGQGGGGYGRIDVLGQVTMDGGTLHAGVNTDTGQTDHLYASGVLTLGGMARLEVFTIGQAAPTGPYYILSSGTDIVGDFLGGKMFWGSVFYYATGTGDGIPGGEAAEYYYLTPAAPPPP